MCEMEEDLLFRILFIVSYAAFASVRIFYRGKTRGRESAKNTEKLGWSGAALSIGILGYIAAVILYVLVPDWILFANIGLTAPIRWIGVVIAFVATSLVLWTHRVLGAQYSARQEIQQEHFIISVGPYNRVRHPMYTGFNLFSISAGIISSNLLLILFAILVLLPFPWLARKEEKMLQKEFGNEYSDYMARTGRFLPPLRKKE